MPELGKFGQMSSRYGETTLETNFDRNHGGGLAVDLYGGPPQWNGKNNICKI